MKFFRLFQPINVGKLTLKNRTVMTAIHLAFSEDGASNERVNHFYWRRAEGGASMLIVGGMASDNYVGYKGMLRMDKDEFIPGYKVLTDGIHQRGSLACAQLLQTGRYGRKEFVYGDDDIISASAVPSKMSGDVSRPMTIDEIKTVCARAGEAALRAKQAGFDCVELTSGSGYMISQFLSPVTNKREDEYGGSFENRCRFGLEMLAAVRAAVGPDYPVFMRVAGNEFIDGGNTNEECVKWCELLEKAGADMIDVTGGWHETLVPQLHSDVPRGGYVYLAEAIKHAVSIPVLSANRHNDPKEAETVLACGQADIIGMCRTLIADPDWPNKASEDRLAEIRRCVVCNQGCFANVFSYKPCRCLLNSATGREYQLQDIPAPAMKKSILVVGAGPGGCQFAISAAQKGYLVTLWEKENYIGGQLNLVSSSPGKSEFNTLPQYFKAMLDKHSVRVILNKEATAKEISDLTESGAFNDIVIATGSLTKTITLPGDGSIPVCSAEEILKGEVIAGKNVLVVGGSSVGCETAAYLAHEAGLSEEKAYFLISQKAETEAKVYGLVNASSRHITIVDIAKIGGGFEFGCGWPVIKDLHRLGVKQHPLTKIQDISGGKVTIEITDCKTGEAKVKELPCDTIVIAVGYAANDALFNELKAAGLPVHNIGNSTGKGNILDAIHQADDLAMSI